MDWRYKIRLYAAYTLLTVGVVAVIAMIAGADMACHYAKSRVFWEAAE